VVALCASSIFGLGRKYLITVVLSPRWTPSVASLEQRERMKFCQHCGSAVLLLSDCLLPAGLASKDISICP
jgi:hypothetical protein